MSVSWNTISISKTRSKDVGFDASQLLFHLYATLLNQEKQKRKKKQAKKNKLKVTFVWFDFNFRVA